MTITKTSSLEEQLSLLAEITQEFAVSLDIEKTLQMTASRTMEYLHAQAVSVFLLAEDRNKLICRACAGPIDLLALEVDADRGIIGKTVKMGLPQLVSDVKTDPDFFDDIDCVTGFETFSVLCAPLQVKGEKLGAIELINKKGEHSAFDRHDQHWLMVLASTASLAIHNAQVLENLVGQQRLQKEIELAREIQDSLLPKDPPIDFPVVGITRPVREISGDFYDFFLLEDGCICFSLADVSGKGLNAALLMAKTCSLFHCLGKNVFSPGSVMAQINREICEKTTRGMFVTMVAGIYIPEGQTVLLANAGHPPALYRQANGNYTEFGAMAPPLGIDPEATFPEEEFQITDGGLYLYSDGLSEALMEESHGNKLTKVHQLIDTLVNFPPRRRLELMVEKVTKGQHHHDDVAILLIEKWHENS